MSDNGAIGVIMHDVAEILSKKYYSYEDNEKVKGYIGFNLIFLRDIIKIIQKEHGINLYLDTELNDISFFKNEEKEFEYLNKQLME